jgi:hypothetical protein
MSWDVSVFASKEAPPAVAEMPDDWRGEVLGSCAEVRSKVSECLPGVDWSNPSWGIYEGEGFSYEFNIGREEPCDGLMVHVRGGGDAIAPLLSLSERWAWYLLDCSQGEWLHRCLDADAGWQGFQAYRDRVLGRSP